MELGFNGDNDMAVKTIKPGQKPVSERPVKR